MKFNVKEAFKRFVYETFRPRTREDYAEIFTRGRGGDDKTPYPWFYSRVFLFCLFLFSILCFGYSFSELNIPSVLFAGGIFADLTFIVLLFEMYPKRDMPLFVPVAVLFAGGLLASAFSYIFYGFEDAISIITVFIFKVGVRADYISQVWTAVVEETAKVIATLITLKIVKKRNPLACLIIGAAVGAGYSAFENMWYMLTLAPVKAGGLSYLMAMGLIRSLGTPFSHAAWAAVYGWAVSGKNSWKRWQPYAVYAFNFVMHFFVNFPLTSAFSGWKGYPVSAVTGILSLALLILLIVKCRKELLHVGAIDGIRTDGMRYSDIIHNSDGRFPKVNIIEQSEFSYGGGLGKPKFIANVLAACAVLALTFMLIGPTCVFGGYNNTAFYTYDKFADALMVAQDGCIFTPDYDRAYVKHDDLSENFAFTYTEKGLVSVIQREKYDEYFYRFEYAYRIYNMESDKYGNYFVRVDGELVLVMRSNGEEVGEFEVIRDAPDKPLTRARRWELVGVELEYGAKIYSARTIYLSRVGVVYFSYPNSTAAVVTPDTELGDTVELHYFNINPNCMSLYYVGDGKFEIMMYEQVPVRKTESIVFTCVFAAAFIGCGVAYIVFKNKSRRYKNVE